MLQFLTAAQDYMKKWITHRFSRREGKTLRNETFEPSNQDSASLASHRLCFLLVLSEDEANPGNK